MKKIFLALAALCLAAPLSAETINLEHRDLKLNANLETTGEAWQKGPVMLMTHGTLAHGRMEIMEALQQAFLDRGVSSLSITLSLGQSDREGMYDCASTHTHKHTDAVEEIGLWQNWLQAQGVNEMVLLGHSRGGNQTARFASAHDSDAIRSVILVAPQTWDEGYEAKDYEKRYGKPLAPLLAKAEKLVAEGKGKALLKSVDFVYCENTTATADAFVSYYRHDPKMNTPSVVESIDKPVLVIAGGADTVVANLPEKMAKVAERDTVSFEVIGGAGHFFRDLYAEDLADIAMEFIGE